MSFTIRMGRNGQEWGREVRDVHEAVRMYAIMVVDGEVAQGGIYDDCNDKIVVRSIDVQRAMTAYYNAHIARSFISKEAQADAMRDWQQFCKQYGQVYDY